MITIIHGENIGESRKFLQNHKDSAKHPMMFDESVTLLELMQIVDGGGLFESEQEIFIDNFLSKRKASKDMDAIVAYLTSHQEKVTVYLWEQKLLTKKQLGNFPKAAVKVFSYPQTIFTFVDALAPHSGKRLIPLFHNTLQSTDPTIVFSMMVRQVRLMLALSDSRSTDTIDEIKYMQTWQQQNLLRQSRYFTKDQLKTLYGKLYEIDLSQKTSSLPFSMTQAIDFFLIGL